MKSKPIHATDSNHTSELSDDALLDIFGGGTGYADTVDAVQGITAQIAGAIHAGVVPAPAPGGATTSHMPAHAGTSASSASAHPISSSPAGALHAASTSAPVGAAHPAASSAPAPVSTAAHPSGPSSAGNHDTATTRPIINHDNDHDYGLPSQAREAIDAAHDRFHQAVDHAHDGFEHIAQGAAELAIAAVELNPVVAGLHVLHGLHQRQGGKTK